MQPMRPKANPEPSKLPSGRKNVPVSLDPELDQEINETARQVKLSKQDTMRLSMARGLPILLAQLTGESQPAATPEEVTADA